MARGRREGVERREGSASAACRAVQRCEGGAMAALLWRGGVVFSEEGVGAGGGGVGTVSGGGATEV